MKTFISFFIILLIAWSMFGNPKRVSCKQSYKKAAGWVKTVQTRYQHIESISGKFAQEIFSPRFGSKNSHGKVFIQIPGKMRWEYVKPNKKLIVSDGKKTWMYDIKDRQALVSKAGGNQSYAMNFLWGQGNLDKDFKALSIKKEGGKIRLLVAPKKEMAGIEKMRIVYDVGKQLVESFSIYDLLGNRNTIVFSKVRINRKIDKKLFEMKIPKGVQIIEMETSESPKF